MHDEGKAYTKSLPAVVLLESAENIADHGALIGLLKCGLFHGLREDEGGRVEE